MKFDLRCKHCCVVSPRLRVKALVKTLEGHRIAEQTSFHFLCAQVGENIRSLETDILCKTKLHAKFNQLLRREEEYNCTRGELGRESVFKTGVMVSEFCVFKEAAAAAEQYGN